MVTEVDETQPELVGRRYRILELIGRGGMGAVYRAQDRLGGLVALKRLLRPSGPLQTAATHVGGSLMPEDMAVALAHEFRTLASLRHPNIISVLDYGFDESQQPYLAMDLLERPVDIVKAGRDQSLERQIHLFVQMLRALAYLHRWGIIHRDLKPQNVLVVDQQVKVLDFGIAMTRDRGTWVPGAAGTLGYLAPEVLEGRPATERSDLYAVGVIAHELFCGRLPFAVLATGVEATVPVVTSRASGNAGKGPTVAMPDHMPPKLGAVVERLLALDPAVRHGSAEEVIAALCEASGQPMPAETKASRESFLQAARLVGRASEKARLAAILKAGLEGRGSAWLIGGESGVGKSRMLDELRAHALVRGATVLRGQAVSEGGSPFYAWRPVLRWLVVLSELDDHEASILKPLVPDIESLIGRPVRDPVDLDAEVAQVRLFSAVEDLFARQRQLAVIMLDDLQWADRETLQLLGRLTALAQRQALLLLGTYRDDERSELPSLLPRMQVLRLGRLAPDEIAELAQSMLGKEACQPSTVALLQRETEGNPFFLVELVRSVAEMNRRQDATAMESITSSESGSGMREIIRRRLSRVPEEARTVLELAAVIGRQIDRQLLEELAPSVDLGSWLLTCADAAVLEVVEDQWRFAHDKLREGMLADLSPMARPVIHRRVAQAIEKVYGETPERMASLAYHWGEAGDHAKEALYTERAGEEALRVGACTAAATHLTRALALVSLDEDEPAGSSLGRGLALVERRLQPILDALGLDAPVTVGGKRVRLGHIEALLAECYFQLGDMTACRAHAESALRHLGRPMPRTVLGWATGTLRQAAVRMLQEVSPPMLSGRPTKSRSVLSEAGRLQSRLTDAFIYSQEALPLLWSGLRMLNLCEPAGPSPELARGYSVMAVVAGTVPLHAVAESWSRRALTVVESTGNRADIAYVLCRSGVYAVYLGRWQEVDAWMKRAIAIVDDVGDLRLAEECRSLLTLASLYQGKFEDAIPLANWLENSARRRGSIQTQQWAPLLQAAGLVRLGRAAEAINALQPVLPWVDQSGGSSEVILTYGPLALAHLRNGDRDAARRAAHRALTTILATKPVAHWNQIGLAATAEVFLSLWEEAHSAEREGAARAARQTCQRLRTFARVFPIGRPYAWLWRGTEAWLSGQRERAFQAWHRCIAESQRLSMPYEEGRAWLELGRHLDRGDPTRAHHLERACELFAELKTNGDLARARAEARR